MAFVNCPPTDIQMTLFTVVSSFYSTLAQKRPHRIIPDHLGCMLLPNAEDSSGPILTKRLLKLEISWRFQQTSREQLNVPASAHVGVKVVV